MMSLIPLGHLFDSEEYLGIIEGMKKNAVEKRSNQIFSCLKCWQVSIAAGP